MKKAFLLVVILFISVISTACINNFAVQELNNKAKAYLDKGDFDNAISRLKSSIDLDSTIFETHYNLGIAYIQAEKYPDAINTLQNAVKLNPDFADAYYTLAVAQENYAKDIIDGSIKNKECNTGKDDVKPDTKDEKVEEKQLTDEEKNQIFQLLNSSIDAYNNYLQKAKNVEDKQDVEQKIEYLKNQAEKYSAVKGE